MPKRKAHNSGRTEKHTLNIMKDLVINRFLGMRKYRNVFKKVAEGMKEGGCVHMVEHIRVENILF